jgi:small conductance mechanosensitive channel
MEEVKALMTVRALSIMAGLAIMLGSILAGYIVRFILRRMFKELPWGQKVGSLISTTVFYAILLFGIFTGLGTMGVNITPIIAGLGLGGFALGYAFKDALSNLLAGALILIYRPFDEGDRISVSGCEGKVTQINLRYTVLDNMTERYMVPNSLILTTPLKIVSPAGEKTNP